MNYAKPSPVCLVLDFKGKINNMMEFEKHICQKRYYALEMSMPNQTIDC